MKFEMNDDILYGYSGSTYGTIEIPENTRHMAAVHFPVQI